ncbi:MAG: YbjQ family protein [Eubacteriales bacterium]|nr:YbjQ family protein [Eubacteriales bacterium]
MLTVTTHSIEGKKIREYKGIVFGEIIVGINVIKDFKAGLTNFFGGRSGSYEEELVMGRNQAIREMEQRAADMGANGIVGVIVDYEAISNQGSNMLMVIASGTAVDLE